MPTNDFEALAESIRRAFPGSRLEPATGEQLAAIRRAHPEVPTHYLEFLQRIGWGTLGGGNFMVYSGPCEPGNILDEETAVELPRILFLGDDFAGWMLGFDTRAEWRLVEVDSSSLDVYPVEQRSLAEFILQRIADSADGQPGAAPHQGRV